MRKKSTILEEESYVLKAQAGDTQALSYLLNCYHNLAYYIALKICHNDADAEDIVQESFIEVHRSIAKLQEPKYFKAWLNKIIFSKCTKLFRTNKDINVSEDEMLYMKNASEQRRYMLPDSSLKFNTDKELLMQCIEQLPEKMKIMIIMMYFEQMSIHEISLACDVPEGTVKSRLNYAKGQLKTMIGEYENREGVKVDFKSKSLEATLTLLFASEGKTILPAFALKKGFHFQFKGHVIEPSMLLIASMGTCLSVAGAVVAYPYIQNAFSPKPEIPLTKEISVAPTKLFPEIIYQGTTIKTAKQAYTALNHSAHCYVELEELREEEQIEAKTVYEALKQHGGVYYELLYNRNYMNEK